MKKKKMAKDTFRSFAIIMKLAFIRLLQAVPNTIGTLQVAPNAHRILDTLYIVCES